MSLEQKSSFKKVTKSLAGVLFIGLLFFNFKIAVNDEKAGGINLLGLKVSAFVSDVFATAYGCTTFDCYGGPDVCVIMNTGGNSWVICGQYPVIIVNG